VTIRNKSKIENIRFPRLQDIQELNDTKEVDIRKFRVYPDVLNFNRLCFKLNQFVYN
jgi:hypothetical protein